MSEKKPRVAAFYRDHPTLQALAEEMKQAEDTAAMKADWHLKALHKIREDYEAEEKTRWTKIIDEMIRLGVVTKEEAAAAGHFHMDFETMTIQRCSGHHGLAKLLGFGQ